MRRLFTRGGPYRGRARASAEPWRVERAVGVARAPIEEIEAVRQAAGVGLHVGLRQYHSDFNYDFHVSFAPRQRSRRAAPATTTAKAIPGSRISPATASSSRTTPAQIFHTYSTYGRGGAEASSACTGISM